MHTTLIRGSVAAVALFTACSAVWACGGASGDGVLGAPAEAGADAAPTPDGATNDGAVVVPTSASCTPDGGVTTSGEPDPAKPRVVTGTNGTFADACDGAGNLVKRACKIKSVCDPGPNPGCTEVDTGEVEAKSIDCAGLCVGGACAAGCPVTGDELTVTSTDGDGKVSFTNKRDNRHYACKLVFQQGSVAYDCKKAPYVGASHFVVGLGLRGRFCTGKDFGSIGTGAGAEPAKQACSFQCDVVP
jgi:hypothetical protein